MAMRLVGVALGATLVVCIGPAPSPAGTATAAATTSRVPAASAPLVVRAVRQGDNNYVASCHDGNRYHVYTSTQGRVVVQKQ
jgi:hypothetical protein